MDKRYESDFANSDFLPELEDLKSDRIFDLPDNYFDQLETDLFSKASLNQTRTINTVAGKPKQRTLHWWMMAAAASVALLLYFGVIHFNGPVTTNNELSDAQIVEYLLESDVEITEFIEAIDEPFLLETSFGEDDEIYYQYIAENMVDFEDIIY